MLRMTIPLTGSETFNATGKVASCGNCGATRETRP